MSNALLRRLPQLGFVLVLSGSALAQRSDAEVLTDIAYARGLAADLGFVDRAEAVIEKVEGEAVSSKMREELGLVRCDVYAAAAKRARDPKDRDSLLAEALRAYSDFIEGNRYSEKIAEAEAAYVATALSYGSSTAERLEEAVGEEAENLRNEMQDTLTGAVAKTGDLIANLQAEPDPTEAQKRQLYELLLNRGNLLLMIAKSQDDGVFNYEQALDAFETLVSEAGEDTPWGLRGFVGMGDVFTAQGQFQDAADFYSYVTELAIPSGEEDYKKLVDDASREELNKRFLFLQIATPGLVSAFVSAGDTQQACSHGLRFHNIWKSQGLDLNSRYGYESLLATARALVDSGGFVGGSQSDGDLQWFATNDEMVQAGFRAKRSQRTALDLALQLAQLTKEENSTNIFALRSQRLIAEITSRPGVVVAPEVLMEAAEGEYNDKNYWAAIDKYKQVLRTIEPLDEATRLEYGANVMWHLGRSWYRLDRYLEATLTYEDAWDRWKGDPVYDEKIANGFYESARKLRASMKDTRFDELYTQAETAVKEASKGEGGRAAEIVYREADRLYSNGDYVAAKAKFAEVDVSAPSYEKAIVSQGLCDYKLKDFDGAIAIFDEYLNKFVTSSENVLTDRTRQARRSEATANAVFYWGLSAYNKRDWQMVIDQLGSFEDDFENQKTYAPAAMYRVLSAHLALGQQDEVDAKYAKMQQMFPEASWTGRGAVDVHNKLDEDYKALKKDGKDDEAAVTRRKMATFLQVANENATSPAYNNLRRESEYWMELGEFETAEPLLQRIMKNFAGTEEDDKVNTFVIPDLGYALLQLKRVQDVYDTLAPLVEDEEARTTRRTARTYAQAIAGYCVVENDDNGRPQLEIVPGLGGEENFTKATEQFERLANSVDEKWTPEWLDLQFDLVYAFKQWGELDSKKVDTAKRMMKTLTTEYGAAFNDVEDEALKKKLSWLATELR